MNRITGILLFVALLLLGCSVRQTDYEPGRLVNTGWLQDHWNDPSVVLLHIGTKESFDTMHIPGARQIYWNEFMINTDSLRHEFPEIDIIDSVLAAKGIDDQSDIVLYYENEQGLLAAARFFVTLDYAGLGDRTFVLNGGLTQWTREDRVTTDSSTVVNQGDLVLAANMSMLFNAADVENRLKQPEFIILDARPEEHYTGEFDSIENKYTGGHIEGALNLPAGSLLDEDHPYLFKEDAGLTEAFEKTGMIPGRTLVHYCGTGILASVDYLVAKHLGYPSKFYDGSFQEWEKLGLPVTRPVAIDPAAQ